MKCFIFKFNNKFTFFKLVNYSSGYEDSEYATRTPSPAPSSGVESNSFKDSPMQIEVINSEGTNSG